MTKVYLLLRNNKQSGPHSLEELLKLGLKPLDLIWVEGKSFGWSYPSEISALKSHVPAADTAAQSLPEKQVASAINNQAYMPAEKQMPVSSEPVNKPKVYVSMPSSGARPVEKPTTVSPLQVETGEPDTAAKIEQKAEELRKRIQSYVPEQKAAIKTEEPVVTKYSSTLPEREEAYTSWLYDKKVNKTNKFTEELQKKWGAIAVAALLILIVGYGISQYHGDKKEVELASAETTNATKDVPQPLITEPEKPSTQPITDNNITEKNSESIVSPVSSESPKKIIKSNTSIATPEKKPVKETHKVVASVDNSKKVDVNKSIPQKETVTKPVAEAKAPEIKNSSKKEAPSVGADTRKKKTLNEKVDAFFSKFGRKLKEDKPPVETPPQTTTTANTNAFPGTVERKAVHRDDKPVTTHAATPPSVAATNLAEYVQVSANKPTENWMLGVHGLKVSLRNTSSETVKTAEVELRYCTDQNELLEKKIVNFSNIPPGKTVTLPIPDHRLADHADVRLVTAK